jgi:MFS family permease
MTIKKIEIGVELGKGWRLFKANMGVLILGNLLATVVAAATCGLLAGPLMVGMLLIAQRLLKGDPDKPQASDVFRGFDSFIQTLLLLVITTVATLVLRYLLMIAGSIPVIVEWLVGLIVYAVGMWMFVFIAYEKMTAIGAIKKVFTLIGSGSFTMPLLFAMVVGLIGSLGLTLLCVVGGFFTLPLTYCLMACCYDTLFGGDAPPPVIDLNGVKIPPLSDLRL